MHSTPRFLQSRPQYENTLGPISSTSRFYCTEHKAHQFALTCWLAFGKLCNDRASCEVPSFPDTI